MSIKSLQDYTYVSKYARFNAKHKRRETWSEAVDRVKEMHLPEVSECWRDEIEWAFDLVKQKRVLGSQRAAQFGGSPIEQKNARIYNCCVSFCDRIRMFQETFWLLLCGCGTGFSVQHHHIAKLHPVSPITACPSGSSRRKPLLIPDSIEGWSDALSILLATYMPHPEFADWEACDVESDYSQIRKAGSVLASGVGKAPGHEPLKRSLEIIRTMLDTLVSDGHERLRPIDAYDIIMHASDAVLSGGVRRSAYDLLVQPRRRVDGECQNWQLVR
jgi:ribonucleoside-diphosphate reductase alpha chain